MKKSLIILPIFLLLIFNLFLISNINAQAGINQLPGISGEINPKTGLPSDIDRLKKVGENLTYAEHRKIMFEIWRSKLLKNEWIEKTDSFLQKFDIVFVVFFGEHYKLSGILFFVIILWFCWFYNFSKILENYSAFSKNIGWVMGFAITIASAHLGIFRKIIEGLIWLAFYKDASWYRFLIFTIIVAVVLIITYLNVKFGKSLKEKHEKDELEEDRQKLKMGAKIAEGVIEGATGKKTS